MTMTINGILWGKKIEGTTLNCGDAASIIPFLSHRLFLATSN
jgi:hypothetical protein